MFLEVFIGIGISLLASYNMAKSGAHSGNRDHSSIKFSFTTQAMKRQAKNLYGVVMFATHSDAVLGGYSKNMGMTFFLCLVYKGMVE